ncbi:MAG: phytanoyl-CoA dioxygenase family protein [Asticcacaulis sp.]|nr:phytanoyl-CoA dioxygenase family protein [Asticcacaulis sp.]
MTPDFERDGAAYFPAVLTMGQATSIVGKLDDVLGGRPGVRITDEAICAALCVWGAMRRIAAGLVGDAARPVRVLAFDKTPEVNWVLAWHQDRTIAVRERVETPGFGPWSVKDGIPHVEPPTELLAGMVTLRLHLDDCGLDNAPLKVALGSHRAGLVPAGQAAATARTLPLCVCLAQAGDVWAYSTLILHASDRAEKPEHRRVIQVDYAAGDLPNGLEWYGLQAKK